MPLWSKNRAWKAIFKQLSWTMSIVWSFTDCIKMSIIGNTKTHICCQAINEDKQKSEGVSDTMYTKFVILG